MEDNKKFELNDDALNEVAGGRDGWAGGSGVVPVKQWIRNPNYSCSNCGGHEFCIVDGGVGFYNGNCRNCGTYNSNISHLDDYAEIFLQ